MDIKLLTQVEKQSIGDRQPLPDRYLRLSDDEMDARIVAAKQKLGDAGRLVIRPSGTEPVIRVMAEGDDEGLVNTVVGDIVEAVKAAAKAA